MIDVDNLLAEAQKKINESGNLQHLDKVRVAYLGKKGSLTELLKQLGGLSAEERPKAGQAINVAKRELQSAIEERPSSKIFYYIIEHIF